MTNRTDIHCTERAWCTVTNSDEHEQFHASAVVELDGSDGDWWLWLTQDVADEAPVRVLMESRDGRCADIDRAGVVLLLQATSAPGARAALEALVAAAAEPDR